MSDDFEKQAPQQDELVELFDKEERGYLRRLADMFKGFGKPKDSVEYKEAIIEFQRLGAPLGAGVIMALAITVMCVIRISADAPKPVVSMEVIEPEQVEELDRPEPEKPEEPPPELDDVQFETDVVVDIDAPPSPTAEQSPQPSPVDAVAMTPSPVIMKNVLGSRTPGTRGGAIGKYGLGATEKYVYGFLRYLAMTQGKNGLWHDHTGATAMALLCFLAHGETPTSSKEFGTVVENAIRGLLDDQIKTQAECTFKGADKAAQHESMRTDKIGYFRHRDTHNYAHLVATYALSEAYAMTHIPDVKEAVERALPHIINGQNADGGWYYNMYPDCPTSDSSYISWAVQALKAAKLAGFHDPKLIAALKKATKGIKVLGNPDGSFGYINSRKTNYLGLTAPCTLIMQMLDEGDSDLCRKSLAYMDSWEPTFEPNHMPAGGSSARKMDGNSPQYYCYYLSQVRFNLGDNNPSWKRWSQQQMRLYSAAAITIPAENSGYVDPEGKPQYITYWGTPNGTKKFKGDAAPLSDVDRLGKQSGTANGKRGGTDLKHLINRDNATANLGWVNDGDGGRILSGCMTALQLMVYYRNSPLAKGALTKIEAEAEVKVEESDDVAIGGADDL